ncbi:GBF-interacting protein 1-like isoform X2 [Sorghum bicolor]|uniref:GBF-interacting protein 1-like isoform X2 n=1 Tax=Sorghum bicolor TaxID=4558 RepID=UPI000B424F88|nr:GBF-interacting protein 1-like isoform X2 [Sorghum bicolor]|eukprot:XP_021320823.1 GBF-interacting protein 1-like isoform X2 [Sorghum bicolor]
MAAGGRVSIPAGARRTVADIKEIAGGHTDEEVYAMLRECNMDPNETAQRLLLEDTFHEVKRKRDKKKEGSKEPSDSRWRPAMQGRGGKSGRGNYSSRTLSSSNDSAGRSAISGKENGISLITGKGSGSTPIINANMDVKASTSMPSLLSGLRNGPYQPVDSPAVLVTSSSAVGDKSGSTALADLTGGLPFEDVVTTIGPNLLQPLRPAPLSDPVVVSFLDSHSLGDVGASRQTIGIKKTSVEHKVGRDLPTNKGSSEQSVPSSFGRSSASRPSSSYNSRSQQSQKATGDVTIHDNAPLAADVIPQSAPVSNSAGTEDPLKVDKYFSDLQLSDKLHVIIPDHLQVSESEKYGLSFGSFDVSFQQTMGSSDPECVKSSLPKFDSSHELNGSIDKPQSMQRDQNSTSTVQEEAGLVPQPSAKVENCAPSAVGISSIAPMEPKECEDYSATSGDPQSTAIYSAPFYLTYGLAPQSHVYQIEKSESHSQSKQAVDFSTKSYHPATDADERLTPSLAAQAAHTYGNIPVVAAQTGQDQEGNNSPVIISSVSASVATPAAGVLSASVAIPQQPVPVFCQPFGVHIPHLQTNCVPYNHYISPFFIPPPTLHPFMGNATFAQPPSTGAMYPTPGSAGVLPPVKYSVPSFKPGANTGSQASIGVPGGHGTYGSSPSVYTNNAPVSSGNLTENDNVTSSQFKENSIYIAGLQTDGLTLWVPTPRRDISALQVNSFYGMPPQGQQVTYAPQAGHGPYGGIYHPAHSVTGAAVHPLLQPSHSMAGAVEIVGAPGVYQHPQAQINWGSY